MKWKQVARSFKLVVSASAVTYIYVYITLGGERDKGACRFCIILVSSFGRMFWELELFLTDEQINGCGKH